MNIYKALSATLLTMVAASLTTVGNEPSQTLHFDRPARYFEESAVIGNGTLGAAIYGGVLCDSLTLNDITLWTGEPERGVTTPEAYRAIGPIREALDAGDYALADSLQRLVQGHYSENYQPLGTLIITTLDMSPDSVIRYSRGLHVDRAEAWKSWTSAHGVTHEARYFASAPDSVIVVTLDYSEPTDIALNLTSQLPATITMLPDGISSTGYAAYTSLPGYVKAAQHHFYDPERGIRYHTLLKVKADGQILSDGALSLKGVTHAEILLTNATSFAGFDRDPAADTTYIDRAVRRIAAAESLGADSLINRHVSDYKSLYDRVSINLGATPDSVAQLPTDVQLRRYTDLGEDNPDLEELYFNFGRYLLISSSRTRGVPANLQGLWNEKVLPPWSSNYTTNINLEENYWPAEVAGLGRLHETALLSWIENLSKSGAETARNYYGVDRGWCLAHNSDIWAMTNPVGLNAGNPVWANWNMGGAWLASHIWEHYLYGRDRDTLARYYPTLKGAAEFCLGWLVERDGRLLTSPSTSPENLYLTPDGYAGATLTGATADLAMIRQCLEDTREAARVLETDSALIAEIDSVLPRLAPYRIGRDGNLQEWYHDWADKEPTHRHQSHLYGIYPGRHITADGNPDLARAALRTLEIKGDNTTGWSTGWRVNLLARLRESEAAYAMYRRLLRYVSPDGYRGPDRRTGGGTYPNLLDAHSPFQIDGNFGGTAGVTEMLLYSTPDTIVPLPALPAAWQTGSARGLRTRTGEIVDMEWVDGHLVKFDVRPVNGQ